MDQSEARYLPTLRSLNLNLVILLSPEKLTRSKLLLIAFYSEFLFIITQLSINFEVLQNSRIMFPFSKQTLALHAKLSCCSNYLTISWLVGLIIISISCNFLILIAQNCETFIAIQVKWFSLSSYTWEYKAREVQGKGKTQLIRNRYFLDSFHWHWH